MSLFDYRASREIEGMGFPFFALLMAAYRQADSANATKLRAGWPEIVAELQARYDAPGGALPGEDVPERLRIEGGG